MERDVPTHTVPITTLSGVASLTDLLPEMQLPAPQSLTLSNKSLLFHPRVAEEAQNLLRARDQGLVPQLVRSLGQTSSDHIDVKDKFMCSESSVDSDEATPELLKAIILANPTIFRNKEECRIAANIMRKEVDPLPVLQLKDPVSPSVQQVTAQNVSLTNCVKTASEAPPTPIPVVAPAPPLPPPPPPPLPPPLPPPSTTTAPMPAAVNSIEISTTVFNDNVESTISKTASVVQPVVPDNLPSVPCNNGLTHMDRIEASPQPTPNNSSTGITEQLRQLRKRTNKIYSPLESLPPNTSQAADAFTELTASIKVEAKTENGPTIMQPFVKLQRLSHEDQMLMQSSLADFIENKPKLAKELGIAKAKEMINYKESDSDGDVDGDGLESRQKRKRKLFEDPDFDTSDVDFVGKRRRLESEKDEPPVIIVKPKLRKVEKKLGPLLKKLSIEELMESNTYGRFNKNVDHILHFYDSIDITDISDGMVPDDNLLSRQIVQELCTEAAKLNMLSAMEMIPADKLVKLLGTLEITIRGADRVSPITDEDNENIRQIWVETAMERVMGAADASLTCLYVLTSRNMPKRVYIEDVIDRVVLFIKYQMQNTIFPSYDITYRVDNKKRDGKKRRSTVVLEKSIQTLYSKTCELVTLLSELLDIQILTDTSILHASSMGVSPFFTENVSELQLSCLKLVTTIFTKYEKHRRLLLDDILASIARLPSTKRSLRTYKLNSNEYIQMLTALVLQLIQCIVALPENINSNKKNEVDIISKVDQDVLISNKNFEAMSTAGSFLSAFLSKCGNKNEEIDYRPLFENFVQDLLSTVNKPEWPATELLLGLLGKLLVSNFSNKSTDMSLRVASLDYLGVVAARLRRDSVLSRCKLNTIDQMIREIRSEEMKENDDIVKQEIEVQNDEERIQFLQRVLLDFLAVNAQHDEAYKYARHFYIVQWYKECNSEKSRLTCGDKLKPKENHHRSKRQNDDSTDDLSENDGAMENHKDAFQSQEEKIRILDERKKFLVAKIRSFKETVSAGNRIKVFETYIDYSSAELISQYLSSKRHLSQSFDHYLKTILTVLKESSIQIRTKAMKCLTMIVEADPSVLGRHDMQVGVNYSFMDLSTSVREAAVDLVGKFVLSRPELISKYYEMLSARILDTGVSVRKRVIKILKDICIECPEFPKIPEICVKMIRRVNDEEGIRKLVMEVFQNMWFSPTPKNASPLRKVMNITDVVASCKDIGLEWFEQLLVSLFKPKEDKDDSTKVNTEPPKTLLLACRQIVDCLIENVLAFEEADTNGGSSQRLTACLTTLYLFAKIRPDLLIKHAITLQPYLSLKCQNQGDRLIINRVAKMLELVVPLMDHPSDNFLSQIETDLMKLILQQERNVVSSCISSLGAIVNRVTRNFKLIRDCFNRFFDYLVVYRDRLILPDRRETVDSIKCRQYFRRSLFTVGLILRHFDFKDPEVTGEALLDVKDKVYDLFSFFLHQDDPDIQANALKAMGLICIRHYEFMLQEELKSFYHRMLTSEHVPLQMKSEVLVNIESYLTEEEIRMIQQDLEWSKRSKQENLKEMGDVSSGMASTIIQLYLKEILQSYLHMSVKIRTPAFKVIQLVLRQGLVHPVQIVPYLICMSTDGELQISHSADKQLQEIEKNYPGFIHAKSTLGIRFSYDLQRILQLGNIVRGFKIKEFGEYPSALNGYLYSLLRNSRQQRRALVLNILKQFDDQARTSLSYMLYLSDNLAYFPYQVQDEVLFIVHHIDIMISVSGTNLLQTFREGLLMTDAQKMALEAANQVALAGGAQPTVQTISALDEDDDDENALTERVPDDVSELLACITAAQGCLLLLVLKQHIKDAFGLSDGKIQQYSPSEPAKVYEKVANRKSNAHFNPKATVNRIKQGTPSDYLDYEGKKELIRQYLDFKALMLKLDPDDADDEENKSIVNTSNITLGAGQTNLPSSSILTEADQLVLSTYKDNSTPKVPKLVISKRMDSSTTKSSTRRRTSEKNTKKVKQKKKRRKLISSSGDESENDYSDPDFMV